ncbi:MAG: TerB family tellurite resistance protein [Polyangiaceae bacterium]|nr:TerB family tellurite resistance protein [Polyangiaceae bacterium]MCE7892974.1 TerB family tellurite resistance protein [Sorangiineae bacterium PRO1]MCL4756135.1 TerB family tellurite resistance protein [Myxococcales bacterium]
MSDEKHKLGKDVYIALAAVGWADGNLDSEEADAIVRTAMDEGLGLAEVEEIEKATKFPVELGEIDRRGMSKEDKLFVYAVASWMTWLDGDVSEAEVAALAKLGDALKIPEKPREHADAIMREVAHQSEDIRPMRYDLGALRRIIHERLEGARAARGGEQQSEG